MSRCLPRSKEIRLIIKELLGCPITYLHCAATANTFVVAVGSIGKEVEELVHWCMRAILQLWEGKMRGKEKMMWQNTEVMRLAT